MARGVIAVFVFVLALLSPRALAVGFPERPSSFVFDQAWLLDAQTTAQIESVCRALRDDKQIPIIVVTISSMASYNAADWTIEEYAASLFNMWGIGRPDFNYGILVLVSEQDRKARIELGADWKHARDGQTSQIMNELMVPQFRDANYEKGILAGVGALDDMARGKSIPRGSIFSRIGGTLANGTRTARNGLTILLLLPLIVINGIFNRAMGRSFFYSSGGGSGGGSFGGGFSGGGGSTGSW